MSGAVCIFLYPTLIPLSGVGAPCFSSCCNKDSAFILDRPAGLTSILLETGVDANDSNAAGIIGLTCLLKHGGAQDNTFLVTYPMTDLYERY
jgi:hypothetical protein